MDEGLFGTRSGCACFCGSSRSNPASPRVFLYTAPAQAAQQPPLPPPAQVDIALSGYATFTTKSITNNGMTQTSTNSAGGLFEARRIQTPWIGYELAFSFNPDNQTITPVQGSCGFYCSLPEEKLSVKDITISADWIFSRDYGRFQPFAVAGFGFTVASTGTKGTYLSLPVKPTLRRWWRRRSRLHVQPRPPPPIPRKHLHRAPLRSRLSEHHRVHPGSASPPSGSITASTTSSPAILLGSSSPVCFRICSRSCTRNCCHPGRRRAHLSARAAVESLPLLSLLLLLLPLPLLLPLLLYL